METRDQRPEPGADAQLAQVVERNIEALVARRRHESARRTLRDRVSDRVTAFTGSMWFVLIHLAFFGGWILLNLPFSPVHRFDPSFVVLAMLASVESIFLSTFVLITQSRMASLADKRADLYLQISLLTEHEVTRVIRLVTAIADKMGIEESRSPELSELARDVAPETVLDSMDRTEEKLNRAEVAPPPP